MSADEQPMEERLTPMTAFSVEMSGFGYLKAMWARQGFVIALPAEQLRASHQNTILGNVWHLANPVLSVLVYFLIFGPVLGIDRGTENYLVWLTIGVFSYRLSQSTIQQCADSLDRNVGLMRSFRFPRAILPVTVSISELMVFGFQMIVVLATLLLSGVSLTSRFLVFPLVVIVHTAFNLGAGFIAARLTDAFADVRELIPFIFRLMLYASGVIFPVERIAERTDSIHPWISVVIENNPITNLLDMYRWAMIGIDVDPAKIIATVVISLLFLVVGFKFFRNVEYRYGR